MENYFNIIFSKSFQTPEGMGCKAGEGSLQDT